MAELVARQEHRKDKHTLRWTATSEQDLFVAVAILAGLIGFFISIDFVEVTFEFTRAHEDWELDELLAAIPALALVTGWYALRRWSEAKRLNLALAEANETLEENHTRILAAEAQARDAQRLEALGRLAGGMAHELNNMLQPTITLTEMTLNDQTLSEASRANLRMVLDASQCSREILEKALTFAGNNRSERQPVAFADCLKEVVELVRTTMAASIRVTVEIPEQPGDARIDRTELAQVMTNLMTNAIRAMDGVGSLAISLRHEAISDYAAVRLGLRAGSYFKLTVKDDGAGMAEDVRRRLFEPFFTTAETPDRVGLGLAVVHGIVTDWDGTISVDSEPGAGTCFTILLPIAAG